MNQYINSKLDWLTVIFKDTTFNNILNFLGMSPDSYVSEFIRGQGERSHGYDNQKFFSFEGVSLETNLMYLLGEVEEDDFNKVFSKIRLDISGTGLDFLRSIGIEVDTHFRNYDLYPQPFNITRCDFAFDMINYKSTFVDDLIDYCLHNTTPAGNVCLLRQKNGVKCSVRNCDQKTVYLGATGSNQLLRVYDKRLQYIDRRTGVYKVKNPYENPDSWIRIELQTRREHAERLLFGKPSTTTDLGNENKNYWFSLFRHIYDTYCFVDLQGTNSHNRRPAEFWLTLYDWNEIGAIIQNQNSSQFVTYRERVVKDFEINILRMLRWFSCIGSRASVQALINSALVSLFDYDDPVQERRRNAYLATLNMLLESDSLTIANSVNECDFGFYRDSGMLGFKL